jgi:F-type H+-transporting ATPase subunit delta
MAELATIARPYAEALFQSTGTGSAALSPQLQAIAGVAAHAQVRQFADNPTADAGQVFDLIAGVAGVALDTKVANLLHTVIDNGRLQALPEIAAQFQALVNSTGGVADALIQSAYPIDASQLAEVCAALEKRFGRKLNPTVALLPELIGGIRVVVGDEVLDTSVKARLEQMKLALTA